MFSPCAKLVVVTNIIICLHQQTLLLIIFSLQNSTPNWHRDIMAFTN